MANRWENNVNIFLGPKISADGDCSHEIKRCLLPGKEVMTNLDSILKSRDITFTTKVHLVKAMVFPVVIYGRESWTIRKAECWRIDAFELWCWRRLWVFRGLQGDQVSDAIQPSHPLSSPSLPSFNISQHQGLFQWVSSLHQIAKVLKFQLQHQSFQWTPRTDLL